MTQSSTATFTAAMRMVGLVLRIMIGWHFLYEGIVKLLDPRWSSAAYLSQDLVAADRAGLTPGHGSRAHSRTGKARRRAATMLFSLSGSRSMLVG